MPKGYYGERNWTEWELLTMEEMLQSGQSDAMIGGRLGRTAEAVNLKRKRLRMKPRRIHGLGARELADRMGIPCSKSIAWWIAEGWLKAKKVSYGHNGMYFITMEAVADFVANPDYWHLWDYDRVNDPDIRFWASEREHDTFIGTGEVASRFYVSVSAVNTWIRRGLLPAAKHGPNWFVRESVLRSFAPPNQRSKKGIKLHRWTEHERAMVVSMRSSGYSYQSIADKLGMTIGQVANRWYRESKKQAHNAASG